MKTTRILSVITAFAVISLAACGDDDPAKPPVVPPPSPYKNLSERGHVLDNLELSYVERNLEKYEELLDDDFTFHLSAGDVGGGLPAQWNRSVEVGAHTILFDPSYSGPKRACESIQLDVRIEDGVTWVESDSPTVPSEKWYTATLLYDFVFNMEGDYHHVSNPGSEARFTVRNAGTEQAPEWRLVEMADLGPDGLFASSGATVQSTWGNVKAEYTELPQFQNLSEMWHVLNNIELAYTRRSVVGYDHVLDADFTFFLSTGDVGGGLPESWGRVVEVQANTNLLSTAQPPAPLKRVLSIQMDIDWEDDQGDPNVAWIEFTPPGLTESWYTTTVYYDFKFELEGDLNYFNLPGSQAQFTVRNAGTEVSPHWQLVEMRDLADSNYFVAGVVVSTEQSTWGQVKALYRG